MVEQGVDRREVLKAALAIGGTGGLAACHAVEDEPTIPTGTKSSVLPERQFAWNAYLPAGRHGNPKLPNHQLLLFLTYRRDGPPSHDDRKQVELALRSLERAYQWGTGDELNPRKTRGLLFFIGYAPRYFERFNTVSYPEVVPHHPETLINDLDEDAAPDRGDAVVVLTSGYVSVLLSAEQALRGRFNTLNGVPVKAALNDTFDIVERRTGFLGAGRPAREFSADIPDKSPTAMGYRSSFRDNQATEERVAFDTPPFVDGTTLQVSRLVFDLESWYEYEEAARVQRMFSPEHTPDQVGDIGEHLGGHSRISRETAKRIFADAEDHDIVGHTQKTAAARTDDFEPKLLRRSEGVSTDLPEPAMNFLSIQQTIDDFREVRRAMDCPATANFAHSDADTVEEGECPADADVPDENDGITGFIETLTRGTYLVPPRSRRAMPLPTTMNDDR